MDCSHAKEIGEIGASLVQTKGQAVDRPAAAGSARANKVAVLYSPDSSHKQFALTRLRRDSLSFSSVHWQEFRRRSEFARAA